MLLVDAHQDLAWNMLTFGRDYTLAAAETRRREAGSLTVERNGDTMLGWPDYQRGRVAVIGATLFAAPKRAQAGTRDSLYYDTFEQANRLYRAQLDLYHRLTDEHPDKFRLLRRRRDLQDVLSAWCSTMPNLVEDERGVKRDVGRPVGLVILMEGAEGVLSPDELEDWWARGVRLIGPAWMGNRFCGGTREPGGLTDEGRALLEAMAGLGFILDLSHMDVKAALQALEIYPGRIVASHSNAAALLKGTESNRHLPDEVLRGLIERDGVTGIVPLNPFLLAGWRKRDDRQQVTLERFIAQIDYVCQQAGDARHVGIGTDFDGGFGLQSTPLELDTIADLLQLTPRLAERGYSATDIAAIMGENWLDVLRQSLPED